MQTFKDNESLYPVGSDQYYWSDRGFDPEMVSLLKNFVERMNELSSTFKNNFRGCEKYVYLNGDIDLEDQDLIVPRVVPHDDTLFSHWSYFANILHLQK